MGYEQRFSSLSHLIFNPCANYTLKKKIIVEDFKNSRICLKLVMDKARQIRKADAFSTHTYSLS